MIKIEKIPDNKIGIILMAIAFVFYISVIFFQKLPFAYDEGSYAIMIKEFSSRPSTILPTITGIYTEWKPPLFSWVYSIFYFLLSKLPIQTELIFRIPSAIFGALNACLMYKIALKFIEKKKAIYASLLFLSAPVVIFASTTVMMEAFSIFLCLLAIENYLNKKFLPGSIALGSIILVKWIYVLIPVLFLTVFFLKTKDDREFIKSLITIPIFAVLYVALTWSVGSLSTLIEIVKLDISRPAPSLGIGIVLIRLFWMIVSTAPLSLFFLYFIKDTELRTKKMLPLAGVGLVAFLMTLSSAYIFWYVSTCIFAFSIIVATKLESKDVFSVFIVACIVLLNILFYYPILENSKINSQEDLTKIVQLTNGKEIYFIEPGLFYDNWWGITNLYRQTNNSYLLLEQNNPGILYYFFNNNTEYHRIKPVYSAYNETVNCDKQIVYHKGKYVDNEQVIPKVIPSCFRLIVNSTNYNIYESRR